MKEEKNVERRETRKEERKKNAIRKTSGNIETQNEHDRKDR